MDKYKVALEKAKENGHNLKDDPPVMASVSRQTCKNCGFAVLGNYSTAYGSALDNKCPKAEQVKKEKKLTGYSCSHCGGGHLGIHCMEDV